MVYYIIFYNYWCILGGENILNKEYLLYGLGISNKKIKEYFDQNNVKYQVFVDGKDHISKINFKNLNYIIKSSGIKFDTQLIKHGIANNIKIISDLEFYYLLNKDKNFILVTGTNGKTSTVSILGDILDITPCGNVGNPIFNNEYKDLILIEASSFMLHNSYTVKPYIYIITSLESHHLDYHKNSCDYFYDKLKLINNMTEEDYLIYNYDIINVLPGKIRSNAKTFTYSFNNNKADLYIKDDLIIFNDFKIDINLLKRNEYHNIENMMAAIIASKILNIDNEIIKNSLINFTGIEFRMEKIVNTNNLVIINDSKSTSPAALNVAIESIKDNYHNFYKILIIGGKLVDIEYKKTNSNIDVFNEIKIFGKSKNLLYNLINHNNIKVYDTLDEVVDSINIVDHTLILFSPSQPSYDLYDNYIQRGNHFNSLINYHKFCN